MIEANRDLSPFDLLQQLEQRCLAQQQGGNRQQGNAREWTGVLCRIGANRVLAPMSMLHEIVPVPEIVKVPGVRAHVRGVTNLHGALIPVVDLQAFLFGQPVASQDPGRRMLVVAEGARRIGLIVNEVQGMKHFFLGDEVRELPPFEAELERFITAALRRFDEHYAVLNLQKLLDDADFCTVAL